MKRLDDKGTQLVTCVVFRGKFRRELIQSGIEPKYTA